MHDVKPTMALLLVITSTTLLSELIASEYKVPPGIISQPEPEAKQEELPPEEVKPKFYRKVNPDGSVEFSDVPDRGAKEIKLAPVPTTKITPAPMYTPGPAAKAAKIYQYKRFEIISPQNEQAIRNNTGNISVQAAIDPRLNTAHKIGWYLNGDPVSGGSGLSLKLFNLERGSHIVVAKILTHKGEVLQETPPVTFFVMRSFKKSAK